MLTVKKLLMDKGLQTWTTSPDTPVSDALIQMVNHDIGALAVVEDSRLVGILSDRDILRKLSQKGKSLRNTLVKEIMTAEMISVNPKQAVDECMAIMHRHRIRYLAVATNSNLDGIVSIDDILHAVIVEQAESLDQLENASQDNNLWEL